MQQKQMQSAYSNQVAAVVQSSRRSTYNGDGGAFASEPVPVSSPKPVPVISAPKPAPKPSLPSLPVIALTQSAPRAPQVTQSPPKAAAMYSGGGYKPLQSPKQLLSAQQSNKLKGEIVPKPVMLSKPIVLFKPKSYGGQGAPPFNGPKVASVGGFNNKPVQHNRPIQGTFSNPVTTVISHDESGRSMSYFKRA